MSQANLLNVDSYYYLIQNQIDAQSLEYVRNYPGQAAEDMGFVLERQFDGTLVTGDMETNIVPVSAKREYFFIVTGADPDSKIVMTDYTPDGEKIGSNAGNTNVALAALAGLLIEGEFRYEILMKETKYNTCRYVFNVYSREIPHHTIN